MWRKTEKNSARVEYVTGCREEVTNQREEEHRVVESKWRKTGGVMILAIPLADWRVTCPTGKIQPSGLQEAEGQCVGEDPKSP